MFIGFIKSFDPNLDNFLFPNYINSLIGGVLGYLIIWLIIFAYKKIKKPAFIFDGRNILDSEKIRKIGFNYFGIGRK